MRWTAVLLLSLVVVATAGAESIWKRAEKAGHAGNRITDFRANRKGDLLTIIVRETHKLTLDESMDRDRKGTLDIALSNFDLKTDAFTKLPAVKGKSSRTFEGKADYDKGGSFQARITVRVVDVLPNGTLVVAGRRTIVMDGEEKFLRLAGLARPADVTASNTILSEQIADARISFKGMGTISRATDPGPLDPIWHALGSLLPF